MASRQAPEDPRFARRPLLTDTLDAVLPAGHPLADRDEIALAELAGEDFVGPPDGTSCHDVTVTGCAAAGFAPAFRHRTLDFHTAMALAAAGLGVTLVPRLGQAAVPPGAIVAPARAPGPGPPRLRRHARRCGAPPGRRRVLDALDQSAERVTTGECSSRRKLPSAQRSTACRCTSPSSPERSARPDVPHGAVRRAARELRDLAPDRAPRAVRAGQSRPLVQRLRRSHAHGLLRVGHARRGRRVPARRERGARGPAARPAAGRAPGAQDRARRRRPGLLRPPVLAPLRRGRSRPPQLPRPRAQLARRRRRVRLGRRALHPRERGDLDERLRRPKRSSCRWRTESASPRPCPSSSPGSPSRATSREGAGGAGVSMVGRRSTAITCALRLAAERSVKRCASIRASATRSDPTTCRSTATADT